MSMALRGPTILLWHAAAIAALAFFSVWGAAQPSSPASESEPEMVAGGLAFSMEMAATAAEMAGNGGVMSPASAAADDIDDAKFMPSRVLAAEFAGKIPGFMTPPPNMTGTWSCVAASPASTFPGMALTGKSRGTAEIYQDVSTAIKVVSQEGGTFRGVYYTQMGQELAAGIVDPSTPLLLPDDDSMAAGEYFFAVFYPDNKRFAIVDSEDISIFFGEMLDDRTLWYVLMEVGDNAIAARGGCKKML